MSILIKNGTILDGSGKKRYLADIEIVDDKIKKTGNFQNKKADLEIDASGLMVAPGFIDIHTHSDSYWTLFTIPSQESFVRQGITTILGGNCGSSLAPLVEGIVISSIQKWANLNEVNVNWLKFGEFLKELEKRKLGLNFGTLVGHATLRRGLLKDEFRDPTNEEINKMRFMLEESLEEGAFGFSTGLAYSHAKISKAEEIIEILRVLKKHKVVYATHLRNEGNDLISSINEAINAVKENENIPLEISHFKLTGEENWSKFKKAIEMVEENKKTGLDINFDVYPYNSTASLLYMLLPDWSLEGGKNALLNRLKDEKTKKKIIEDLKVKNYDYSNYTIAVLPGQKNLIGKTIREIAQKEQIHPAESLINMIMISKDRAIVFNETVSEENLELAISHPLSFISSDGSGYDSKYSKKGELVHPRSFGSFPKVLGTYAREKKLVSLEEAIYKMSGGPAKKFGIKARGFIDKNYFADIVIFDPRNVGSNADFNNPYKYPKGIEYVLINGEIIVKKGEYSGKMAGKVLRKNG